MNTFHVKKGDKVVVNAGNFKGAEATVSAILAAKERVVLELTKGENKLGKRTVKRAKPTPMAVWLSVPCRLRSAMLL